MLPTAAHWVFVAAWASIIDDELSDYGEIMLKRASIRIGWCGVADEKICSFYPRGEDSAEHVGRLFGEEAQGIGMP